MKTNSSLRKLSLGFVVAVIRFGKRANKETSPSVFNLFAAKQRVNHADWPVSINKS